jgi:hypothetical protein
VLSAKFLQQMGLQITAVGLRTHLQYTNSDGQLRHKNMTRQLYAQYTVGRYERR